MKREAFGLILAAFAGAAVAADVKDLSVVQNPSSKLVTISFSLEEKSIVTMDVLTNGVSIGAENYRSVRDAQSAGTAFPANRIVAAGPHVWTWKPRRDWPDRHFENGELSVIVTAWSLDDPPDYMVLTCNATSNTPSFYARVEDLPDGGIKTADPNDAEAVEALKQDAYRTSKLVLRKIPAAGVKWRMGSPTDEANRQANEVPHYVTLTNDYYVSIYPLTFTQTRVLLGTEDSVSVNINPKYNYPYTEGRGNYSTSYSWPDDGYAVTSDSGFGKMRARTGLRFDFLTEAEWEYACRAGTEGRWNDDGSDPNAVLQSNWYYGGSFDYKDPYMGEYASRAIKTYLALEEAGFDQVPCGSDYLSPKSMPETVRFCREHIAPERLKGFLIAPWHGACLPKNEPKFMSAMDCMKAAMS